MLRIALTALLVAIGAVALPLTRCQAQDDLRRFEITAPTDTTFNIVLGSTRWVKPGMTGTVVDPRQRDQLVAKFRVDKIDSRTARAVITGTTTSISVFHTALLRAPKKSFFKDKFFWIGTGLGLALGFFVGKA